MKKDKLIPKRRFKEFQNDGAWEQRKLSDVVSLFGGNAFSSQDSVDSGARWLKIANVGTGQLKWNDESFLPISYLDDYSSYHLKVGDYVMALTRPILNHELKVAEIAGDDILLNQRVAKLIFTGDAKFGYHMLRKRSTVDRIENELAGTDPPNLSVNTLNHIDIRIPNLDEQKKIGTFFKSIDNLITLHQHKLKKLKETKSAYLSEMFPKDGEKYPKRRFTGFTDPWEQRKLGELCDIFTDGDWIESKDQSDSGIRLVQTGNIGITEYLDKPNNMKWISQETFERLRCKEVLPGDLLISRLPEPAGRACIMPSLGTKMITAVDCTIVRTTPDYSNNFLVQFLSTQNYFNKVNAVLAGGTRQRISRGNLGSLDVPTPPTYEEQETIGVFLQRLDNLITLHQRKLEKLENLKKAYLNEMFV